MNPSDYISGLRPVTPVTINAMLWNMGEVEFLDYERDDFCYVWRAFIVEGHVE